MVKTCGMLLWIAGGLILAMGLNVFAATELLDGAEAKVALLQSGKSPKWVDSVTVNDCGEYAFRIIFETHDAAKYETLILKKPAEALEVLLNGKPVPLPLDEGVVYETVPGIPPSMLQDGTNVVFCETYVGVNTAKKKRWKYEGKKTVVSMEKAGFSLMGLTGEDLALQTGPILGWATPNSIAMTCRINMPAEMMLVIGDKDFRSPEGMMHKFTADGLTDDTVYSYVLKGRLPGRSEWKVLSEQHKVRTYPEGGKLEFVIMGDGRRPRHWRRVAEAVVERNPLFCTFCGDMVTRGSIDSLWDNDFFGEAKELFASIPFYGLLGNHEERSVLFTHFFSTPSGTPVWHQKIGPVHIIAIEGEGNWSETGKNFSWLEEVLAKSDAKFVFLCSHFPPWTSGKHGQLVRNRPKSRDIKSARNVILPLLVKYNATAMIASHDCCYERSEVPGGVTVLVSGGAGSPLTEKYIDREGRVLNPYSKVFRSAYHYCWFSVEGDTCTMTAITPEGEILDTRTWNARKTGKPQDNSD